MEYVLTKDTSQGEVTVAAIPCDQFVEKYLRDQLSQSQIDTVNDELKQLASTFRCPDTDYFLISGDRSGVNLKFEVRMSDELQQ